LTQKLLQPALGGVILLILDQVRGEAFDALGQERNLHRGRTRVVCARTEDENTQYEPSSVTNSRVKPHHDADMGSDTTRARRDPVFGAYVLALFWKPLTSLIAGRVRLSAATTWRAPLFVACVFLLANELEAFDFTAVLRVEKRR
jgi:hypothetical protein